MSVANKVIVGLDLSEYDKQVLTYIKQVNMITRPEKVVFLNVFEEIDLPKEVLEKFPDLESRLSQEQVKKLVDECGEFNIVGTDIEYQAHEGNPLKEIMKTAKDQRADLIVVGKKSVSESGVSHIKLVRTAYCDVLLVTENANPSIKKIMVATDFSNYSKGALEKAIALAEKTDAEIILQHTYHVPTGYSKTGKSYEEFGEIMHGNAKSDCEKFLSDIDTKGVSIDKLFVLGDKNDDHEHILNAAQASKSDVIVMGAKGRTNLSAFLVGSVTEKVITSSKIPVYVAKKKNSEFGLLDAVLS